MWISQTEKTLRVSVIQSTHSSATSRPRNHHSTPSKGYVLCSSDCLLGIYASSLCEFVVTAQKEEFICFVTVDAGEGGNGCQRELACAACTCTGSCIIGDSCCRPSPSYESPSQGTQFFRGIPPTTAILHALSDSTGRMSKGISPLGRLLVRLLPPKSIHHDALHGNLAPKPCCACVTLECLGCKLEDRDADGLQARP